MVLYENSGMIKITTKKKEFRGKFVKVDKVYPQGYPAVIDRLATVGSRLLIADVGSWTVDFVPIVTDAPTRQGLFLSITE